MDEKKYYLAFSLSPIGPKRFKSLLSFCGTAEKAWNGSDKEFKEAGVVGKFFTNFDEFRKTFDIGDYLTKLKKAKVEFIPQFEKDFPKNLNILEDKPIGLFIKGNKKLLQGRVIPSKEGIQAINQTGSPIVVGDDRFTIGVVGARKITSYGSQVTSKLVAELCSAGFVIVSGMAMGVDGIAHKTAIDNKGLTIAVLGCGVDCPYPKENERLYEEILDSGGLVISEYPLGMTANKGTFPARNRIIAGLSSSVLITEAAEDSGSLITADEAIKQGKTVFAVPGPITSQMSKGAFKLLKQGAVLVQSGDDIMDALNIKNKKLNIKNTNKKLNSLKLAKEEKKIFQILESEERTIDEIAKLTKIPISKLSIILSGMEIGGIVSSSGGSFKSRLYE